MAREVVAGVLIAANNVVAVAVDLDIATDRHVAWRGELVVLVHVLVLGSAQEWAFNDARILDGRLVDRNGIVAQVVRNDETTIHVFWNACVEACCVAQDFFVIVHCLEEVSLWFLWHQVVDVAKRVCLRPEAVVWRDLLVHWGARGRHQNCT